MSLGPTHPYVGRFSGRYYPHGRALGACDWSPSGDWAALAAAVIDTYTGYISENGVPLGPRAAGYRLKGRDIAGRTVVKVGTGPQVWSFAQVAELTVMLRRSGSLPWSWVEDGKTTHAVDLLTDDLHGSLLALVEDYAPDLLADQPVHVEVFCEARGGTALWHSAVAEFGVGVRGLGGMAAVSAARDAALRWSRIGKPVTCLLVTDGDDAGLTVADRFAEEVESFGSHVEVEWLRPLVTVEQMRDWFPGQATVEVEQVIADRSSEAKALLSGLVGDRLDGDVLVESLARFQSDSGEALRLLGGAR